MTSTVPAATGRTPHQGDEQSAASATAISGASSLSSSANPPNARSMYGYVPKNRASSTSRPKVGNTL
jgi:hypothetical protein